MHILLFRVIKYTNLNLGTTIDVAKNWELLPIIYDINENLAKSSRPTYSAAWTGMVWFLGWMRMEIGYMWIRMEM